MTGAHARLQGDAAAAHGVLAPAWGPCGMAWPKQLVGRVRWSNRQCSIVVERLPAYPDPPPCALPPQPFLCSSLPQVVGVHPKGYLLCQVLQPFIGGLGEANSMSAVGATVAVPLSLCPRYLLHPGELPVNGQQQHQRWAPWDLPQPPATDGTAAAPAAADGQQQQQPSAAGAELSAATLQSWRQGVLSMWQVPFLHLNLQLLPLQQQQDPVSLQAHADRREQEAQSEGGRLSGRPGFAAEDRQGGFGDAANLLLLARVAGDMWE